MFSLLISVLKFVFMPLSLLTTNVWPLIVTVRSSDLTSQFRTTVHTNMYWCTLHVLGRQLEQLLVMNKLLATWNYENDKTVSPNNFITGFMTLSNATFLFTNDTQLYSHHNKQQDSKLSYISYSFPWVLRLVRTTTMWWTKTVLAQPSFVINWADKQVKNSRIHL